MDGNSCWIWPHRKIYYILKPWKWFAQLGRNVRATYMRARYGWCYMDVWNWDSWFLETIPSMFRYLANYGHGYPCDFSSDEWKQWLLDMAFKIEDCNEEKYRKKNEFFDEYIKSFDEDTEEHKEIARKFFERDKELAREADTKIKEVLKEIGENFWAIWD